MNITLIAAIGRNNEIGKNNDLIWHLHEDAILNHYFFQSHYFYL